MLIFTANGLLMYGFIMSILLGLVIAHDCVTE